MTKINIYRKQDVVSIDQDGIRLKEGEELCLPQSYDVKPLQVLSDYMDRNRLNLSFTFVPISGQIEEPASIISVVEVIEGGHIDYYPYVIVGEWGGRLVFHAFIDPCEPHTRRERP
jgi:hypothetical protein